ncbi:ABC transporter permease [candidate division KSB1 bacterium]
MFSNLYMIKLAFRNVFRNKRRSLLTMVVIMFSVGTFLFMMSYFEGFLNSFVEDAMKATGHIYIQDPEYRLKERMLSLTVPVENYEQTREAVLAIDGIKTVTGRIRFGGLIDFHGNNEPGMGMGIDTEYEREIMEIENSIIKGTYFSGGNHETIIGVELARTLNIDIGDTITVISTTAFSSLAAENFIVTGIADMLIGMMNRLFYIPLDAAQTMLDMEDQAAEIIVFIDDPEEHRVFQERIRSLPEISGRYSVYRWDERGMLQYLPIARLFIVILILVFGIIAAFSIINTMLMAVLERTNEIGVMTAFGMQRRSVLTIFLLEAVVLGIFGGIVGLAVGGFGGYLMETHGLTMGEIVNDFPMPLRQTLYADLQWSQAVVALAVGIIISALSALPPALKAARLEPTDALRRQ